MATDDDDEIETRVDERGLDPLASIQAGPDSTAARVRNSALEGQLPSETAVDALPAGAKQIDPLASMDAGPDSTAARVRNSALTDDIEDKVDINERISGRNASAAQILRDRALEKVRESGADDLSVTLKRPPQHAFDQSLRPIPKTPSRSRSREVDDADNLPPFDAVDDSLIAQLRALPQDGEEPDWALMQKEIRRQTGDQPTYVPWWKSWRYLVPLGGMLAAAATVFLVVKSARSHHEQTSLVTAPRDAGVVEHPGVDTTDHAPTLWLDGQPVEIDDAVEPEALEALATDPDDGDATDDDATDDSGILPISDYGWIDALDDDDVSRAESWLARKRS